MPKTVTTPPDYPLFRLYNLDWLAGRTGYRVRYLESIRCGEQPANPTFRRACSERLGQTQAELFGAENGEVAATG